MSGNEFKLTIAREWLCCYSASPETGWRDCSISSVAYCKVHVRCSSAIRMLGKNECNDSEEERGKNRKSENIGELKKKERKLKRERIGSSLVEEEVERKEDSGGNNKKRK